MQGTPSFPMGLPEAAQEPLTGGGGPPEVPLPGDEEAAAPAPAQAQEQGEGQEAEMPGRPFAYGGEETLALHTEAKKGVHASAEEEADLYSGQSEIEQVALTVPVEDDPSLPVWTFRMWVLGLLSCGALAFLNQFFYYRQAPLMVTSITAQIITLYLGRFMALVLPKNSILNPGPFNMKEHVLITVFANTAGSGSAYAVDIVTLTNSPAFYNSYMPFIAAWLVVITTQCLGYGWAGLMRRFVVEPGSMWWPNNLINVSLFHTLHEKDERQPGELGRFTFFAVVAVASFFYYALPGYVFQILASFAVVCFIWPNSIVAQQIGSGYSGMGIGALSFDWATAVAFNGSPLATPWHVLVNMFLGFILMMWVAQPFLYWYNVYNARNFEFFGSDLYNADGSYYDVSLVVDPNTLTLNQTAFEQYGAPSISVFFAFTYGISFAALTATVVHVALWNGPEIVKQTRAARASTDVHTRILKANYRDCPDWWFVLLMVVCLGLAMMTVEVWKSTLQLPWWGVLFAAAFSGALTLPIGIITATTNQIPGLNVITELIMGYILPGQPIANVLFKTYGYISSWQAILFLQDFKLGTYMKIPPRSMFIVQVLGTIVAGTVNLATAWWQLNSIPYICQTSNPDFPPDSLWTCPSSHVFFDASIIWGLIGPANIFGANGKYSAQMWWWLVGAVAPIPFWLLYKYVWPKRTWLRLVNFPVFFGSIGMAPPAGTINYTAWFIWGFVFEYYLFKHHRRWWARYNYLFSAAMTTGIAFMAVILFFAFQNTQISLDWWGNQTECPIATCPTTNSASLAFNDNGGSCPVWQ